MLHETHRKWIETRGLDPVLAEKMGLATEKTATAAWLSIPYVERGQTLNHKYRLTSEKRHRMDPDAPLCLWNHDVLLDESVRSARQPVLITEGEWDAIAAIQSGFRHAISVPNGAPKELTEDMADPEVKRYQYLWRSRELLDNVGQFILATDADGPGRVLAADLVRWLGPERCRIVEYQLGAKDLNELLIKAGPDYVAHTIQTAKPYPVKGLFRISDFPDPGPVHSIPIGVPGLCDHISIVPGSLTVLTGFAGMGKTSLVIAIIAHLIKHNVGVCMGSFETMPRPILERKLRAAILGCGEYTIPADRLNEVDDLIEDNLSVIAQMVGEEDEMDLDDLLASARIAVKRDNARLLVIDPWNEIEHKRRAGETETEYVSRALRTIKTFMRQHQVAVWIVAHPRVPEANLSKSHIPGLYSISGSANWANKADFGVAYSRNKETNIVTVRVNKVRMGMPGKEGDVSLTYDWRTSSFVEVAQ